jgi:hypothetical protein
MALRVPVNVAVVAVAQVAGGQVRGGRLLVAEGTFHFGGHDLLLSSGFLLSSAAKTPARQLS